MDVSVNENNEKSIHLYKQADPVEPSAPGVRYLGTVRMMTTVNTRDRKRRAHANVGLYTMIYLKVYK